VCKYGLLYLVDSAIAVLRVQLRFVDCINKRKKKKSFGQIYRPMQFLTRNHHISLIIPSVQLHSPKISLGTVGGRARPLTGGVPPPPLRITSAVY